MSECSGKPDVEHETVLPEYCLRSEVAVVGLTRDSEKGPVIALRAGSPILGDHAPPTVLVEPAVSEKRTRKIRQLFAASAVKAFPSLHNPILV